MSDSTAPARDGRSLRWDGHRARRRAELVDVALSVIAREGPEATVEQIAASAKVSRQVLYRQFADRLDLDIAIADAVASEVLDRMSAHLNSQRGIEHGLRSALDSYVGWVQANESVYWFIRSREAAPGTSQTVRRVRDSLVAAVAAIVESEIAQAGQRSDVPVHDVFAVGAVGMADAVVSHWLSSDTGVTRDRLVDSLIALITAAVDSMMPATDGSRSSS